MKKFLQMENSIFVSITIFILIIMGCTTNKILNQQEKSVNTQQVLTGIWEDIETHARHTIQEKNQKLTLTSIVDDDGEAYEIKKVQWDGRILKWTYLVPSTGYIINFETQYVKDNSLWCSWSNQCESGRQKFVRIM